MLVQMEVRTGPCAAGPLGMSGAGVPILARSSTGTSTVSESAFGCRASTIVTGRPVTGGCSALNSSCNASRTFPGFAGRGVVVRARPCRRPATSGSRSDAPPRNRATSSSGRCVAESPMRWSGVSINASRRSSESTRCAPRLVGTSA